MSTKVTTFQSPEVRVVEASAGSGKTYALAKRYVQLLLNPKLQLEEIPIRNILAITFTNKAAFEMKARILTFLKSLALEQMEDNQSSDMLEPLNVSSDQAKQKASSVMEEVIHHYNYFQVQTIDKFINALLSGCAFKIGLTANFRIRTNSREYLEYSLDQLIDQASTDTSLANMFGAFLHHYLYLENRLGWFPKDDMLAIVKNLFGQNNAYGLAFIPSMISSEDIIKKKRKILKDIKALKEVLPPEADKRFVKALDNFLLKNTHSFDIDSISNYFTRMIPPVTKKTKPSAEIEDLWQTITRDLKELCEEEAYSLFNPYIDIFDATLSGFYAAAKKDDVLFLEELNKKAGFLFDEDHITVEELYYRLATRFHHYLVDEFQDTSRLQWKNLEQMTEEALSTGGTLFYVGDRKQAIYSFRGGDVELFDNVAQNFNAFNVINEALVKNWRSQKAIVEFNNHIFTMDNLKDFLSKKEDYENEKKKANPVYFSPEDVKTIEQIYGGAQQDIDDGNKEGYVKLEYVDIDKKDERDEVIREKLIALVKDLNKRFAFRDIAILTRSNSDIEMMTNWLLAEGILVNSERTSNVKENSVIQELVYFLQFLYSPVDNVSFVQFILGDVFSKASGIAQEDLHNFVFELRGRMLAEKDFYIYRAFRKKYKQEWGHFVEPFFRNVGLYPLYELTLSIFSQYKLLDHFGHYQGFLMHFLELIKSQEEEYADLGAFLEYFENLIGEDSYVEIADSDAVKILTIHKSKGLEFPVVILPHLGMDVQVGTSSENQQSFVMQQVNDRIQLLRLKSKYLSFSDELYQIYSREYKKAFLAELNNVYVALTRPVYELYAFIPKRVGNSFNYVQFLTPEGQHEWGTQKKYKREKSGEQQVKHLPTSQYKDWMAYLKDEFKGKDDLKLRTQRLKGEVIHYILSFVLEVSDKNVDEVKAQALAEAKIVFPQVHNFSEYETMLDKILNSDELKPFFYTEDEVLNEKEVVNTFGHTKRIDRLVISKDQVTILDYKTSTEESDEQIQQVQEYKDIIQTIYPKHTVKGYLVYLDDLKVKDV